VQILTHVRLVIAQEPEMSIIDTMVVFDAETIWETYQSSAGRTSSTPYAIAHKDLFMIAPAVYLQDSKTQATPDLNLRAEVGDEIRWAGITLSEDIKYAVVIYDIGLNPNAKNNVQVTSNPLPKLAHPLVPIPVELPGNIINPLEYTTQVIPEYYLSCDVVDSGTESYAVYFYITKQTSANHVQTLGYFWWDPTITVA
jgi:hypothetical protein